MIRNFNKRLFGKLLRYHRTTNADFNSGLLLQHAFNGDQNGLFYYLGTNNNTSSWTNPHSSGAVFAGGFQDGSAAYTFHYVNRASSEYLFLGPRAAFGAYIGFDIGANNSSRALSLQKYSLRNYTSADRFIRTWRFQGSNNVSANTQNGFGFATWVDLDIRNNDTTMNGGASAWATYTPNQNITSDFRFFRLVVTGHDSLGGSGSTYYTTIVEVELYGLLKGN